MGLAQQRDGLRAELFAMNAEAETQSGVLGRGPVFWGSLFVISMFGMAALVASGAIEEPASTMLMIAPMLLLLPFIKSAERKGATNGCVNPIIVRYNRRVLFSSFGYVLGLGIAISIWNRFEVTGGAALALALLPTIPTFFMIWAMGRYLIEETDEYLRHRAMLAAIISLGLVLAGGIFWGFLEMFEVVPHVWAWWVLPVWAIGLGLAQLALKVRDR
jgi:hypothetical protein